MSKEKHKDEGKSPLLDSLPKLNCFKVPDGYFNRLHQSVMLRVEVEEQPFAQTLDALKSATPFALPDNYFDSLANRIADKVNPAGISLEETHIAEGFTVPEKYFDTLYLRIAERISAGNAVARPWWMPAPQLRPVLAFAAVAVVAAVVVWPFVGGDSTHQPKTVVADNSKPKGEVTQPKVKLINPDDKDQNQPPLIAPNVILVKTPKKQAPVKVLPAAQNNSVADLDEYFDLADVGPEALLSELPAGETAEDAGLEEIITLENIDIADLVNGGM